MKKKISMILAVLMLMLCLPVSAVAASESEEVTIQTEIFSGFDITIPGSIAEKYRWSEGGLEGANWIHFYDRSKFDASGGKSSYELADEEKGYLFSIRQYYYDSDYRYGMGDPLFYELLFKHLSYFRIHSGEKLIRHFHYCNFAAKGIECTGKFNTYNAASDYYQLTGQFL